MIKMLPDGSRQSRLVLPARALQDERFRLWTLLIAICLLSACSVATPEASLPTVSARPTLVKTVPPTSGVPPTVVEASPSTPGARPTRTVYPETLSGYIPNPYMGWQDTRRENKRFVETVGYRRVNWDEVNPAEGVYDWSPIERLRADMAELGGTISFRIRPAQPPPWGEGHTMPDWLVERGALIADATSDILEDAATTEPLYSGCLFLEAHSQLVDAMRQRYDGDPQVAFIDIGSYGGYGEWWSDQYDDEPDTLDWHARRRIVDMYLGGQDTRPCQEADGRIAQVAYDYVGFQQTQLIMPYTPWFADSLVYALNRRPDIGIRHDALGSESHQKSYRREIAPLVQQRWPSAPIIFEYYPEAYTPEALRSARDFAAEMHASLVHENFDGRGSSDLIESLLETIGYRLVLQEITYTAELGPGEALAIEMTWVNTGSAPPYYETYPLVVSLTDVQDLSLLEQRLAPDIRDWLPGEPVELTSTLHLPAFFPVGTYDLRVAFVDPVTKRPVLALAIAGRDEQGRYLIGPVDVLP